MSRYSLTTLGMVNALGDNLGAIRERLFCGRLERLSKHTLRTTGETVPVGMVHETLPDLPLSLKRFQCRNHALALMAFRQIQASVKSLRDKIGPERLAVVIGSSTSGIDSSENAFFQWRASGALPPDYHYRTQHEMESVSEFLAALAGAKGPVYTLSTACSSSAKVFASARTLLDLGVCDAVLVGGVDTLCHLTLNGFEALGSLSRVPSNPMSRNRDGLNIGEGAALFILSREEGPIALLGVGESSDAYHISAPCPDGKGAETAIRLALADAELEPEAIHYVNLHGTGTPQNDAMEALAIHRVFGRVPASSTKPFVGHCLGAAGAMEIGFCWLALDSAARESITLPPHHWDGVADEALPALNLVPANSSVKVDGPIHFLSNSFAFGGSNCAVILGKGRSFPSLAAKDTEGTLHLRSWSAWSPGLPDRQAWKKWLPDRKTMADSPAHPPCTEVLPLVRRRCARLARMVLETAFSACRDAQVEPACVHHIHVSRHGELATTKKLFDALYDRVPLSPALFSGSVHHTPSAYFDLAVKNTFLSRTISAGENGLFCGLLEALGLARRHPLVPVLLTFADEPPPEPFRPVADGAPLPFAVAFLFDAGKPLYIAHVDQTKNVELFDFLQDVAGSEIQESQ